MGTHHCFCTSCFMGSRRGTISFQGNSIPKAMLQMKKNDHEDEEPVSGGFYFIVDEMLFYYNYKGDKSLQELDNKKSTKHREKENVLFLTLY